MLECWHVAGVDLFQAGEWGLRLLVLGLLRLRGGCAQVRAECFSLAACGSCGAATGAEVVVSGVNEAIAKRTVSEVVCFEVICGHRAKAEVPAMFVQVRSHGLVAGVASPARVGSGARAPWNRAKHPAASCLTKVWWWWKRL